MPRSRRPSFADLLDKRTLSPVIELHDGPDDARPGRNSISVSTTSSQTRVSERTRPPPPNFSRPRPRQQVRTQEQDSQSQSQEQKSHSGAPQLETVNADFQWDDHLKDMQPLQPSLAQQPEASLAITSSVSNTKQHRQDILEDDCEWDGDDARSHHTVSELGDDDQEPVLSETSSLDSGQSLISLSDVDMKKLKKKGISPALYLEMKHARQGRRKWINPLAGNSYLS